MWKDRDDFEAKANIPAGYGIVTDGEILPDDLVWSWPTREWLPADSPDWAQEPVKLVEDAVCVVRTGRPNLNAAGGVRRYVISRKPAEPVQQKPQGSLFE